MVECCLLQVALHDQVGGCQNFWRAKPEYVQQYGLATVIPQDVQEVLAVARARQRPRRGGEHLPPILTALLFPRYPVLLCAVMKCTSMALCSTDTVNAQAL